MILNIIGWFSLSVAFIACVCLLFINNKKPEVYRDVLRNIGLFLICAAICFQNQNKVYVKETCILKIKDQSGNGMDIDLTSIPICH